MTACGNKENTISSENEHKTEDEASDDSHNMLSPFLWVTWKFSPRHVFFFFNLKINPT